MREIPVRLSTVTLDIEVIEQWADWLDCGDFAALGRDFREVLDFPERCQPIPQPQTATGDGGVQISGAVNSNIHIR